MDKPTFPIRTIPDYAGDQTLADMFDELAKVVGGLRVNPETIFHESESYIDCNGNRCWRPKGEGERMRHENRLARLREVQRHEAILREEKRRRDEAVERQIDDQLHDEAFP